MRDRQRDGLGEGEKGRHRQTVETKRGTQKYNQRGGRKREKDRICFLVIFQRFLFNVLLSWTFAVIDCQMTRNLCP